MPVLEQQSVYPVPVEELFAWHTRPGAAQRLIPPWENVEIRTYSGGIHVGAQVDLRMRLGLVPVRWLALHDLYEENRRFRDIQVRGPFARWEHEHRFEAAPVGAALTDHVEYELPLHPLGDWFGGRYVRSTLERTFRYRHALLGYDLERHHRFHMQGVRRFQVRGAPGAIDTALRAFLSTGGHSPADVHGDADWVIQFVPSDGAELDLEWLHSPPVLRRKPAVIVVEGPSARSEDGWLDASVRDVALAEAAGAGIRAVWLRTGHVLTPAGGSLRELVRAMAARRQVRSGREGFRWISIEDLLGIIQFAAFHPSLCGPVEASAPGRASTADFLGTVRRVMKHPAQTDLQSPAATSVPLLSEHDFDFLFPELERALRFLLGR